jgi:uncharacterized protein YbjT (DUF2867 family)
VILVTGATGNVGDEVTRALAAAGHPVRALTRNPAAADLPPGAELARGDLNDPGSLTGVFDGVTAVFLLTAPAPKAAPLRRQAHAKD